MASPILYQVPLSSVTILDIPRSLEQAQGPEFKQKLISSAPLQSPYPPVEPKSEKARANLGVPSIDELLLEKHIDLVVQDVREKYHGPWCLPRTTTREEDGYDEAQPAKRRKLGDKDIKSCVGEQNKREEMDGPLFQNPGTSPLHLTSSNHLPPNSTALQGNISNTLPIFLTKAPKFNLILLDPPWPNRSARRKGSYELSTDIRSLLSSIPIEDHVEENGFVGVWITNKALFREMVLEDGGIFDLWDVEFVEEWIWLKVTEYGKPICKLDSAWRKPYEVLLVGRKKPLFSKCDTKEEAAHLDEGVKRRVIIGVPDLHSRKPNLKRLFGDVIGDEDFRGLEIFARNMTEGWWSWGNDVLKFQGEEHWVEP